MKFDYECDLAIIGSGPAGMTAAIYAARANLNVIMLDKNSPGGKVLTTSSVENYPGFNYITGPDLSLKLFEQTQKLNTKFVFDEAVNINVENNYKYVELKSNKLIKAKSVIIATGMINKKIGVINEINFLHKGISYCAICDGALYKGKNVAVIGSGKSAVEEAIFLSNIVNHVTLISNKKEFKADKKDSEHLKNINNIEVIMNINTLSFNGDKSLESVTIEEIDTKQKRDIFVEGAFIFIGFLPIAPLIDNQSILSPVTRFIDVDDNMQTSIEGIFAAGDIISKKIRQISTAISDGTIAALSVVEYIKNQKWN